MVNRHAIILNPALSVRGERYEVVEGKTPEITVKGARALLASIKGSDLVSLRDRAVVAILIYTAARAGAVATLRRAGLYNSGEQWMLHFDEKGGKSREIPVRHDLEQMVFEYIAAAGIGDAPADSPLFRTAIRKSGKLTEKSMPGVDVCRMVKRRLRDAGLATRLSPHSFRVTTITDLARARRAARRRPAPGRPRRPAHYPPLRPPRQEDHPQHRRADLDLRFLELECMFVLPRFYRCA
jgi:integrase/recombinase XerD